jgi:phospholipase/carboxylesterase
MAPSAVSPDEGAVRGRLAARPWQPRPPRPLPPGEHPLGLATGRDGVLYVPASYRPERPAPLLLCLHGARSAGSRSVLALREPAERHGLLLLAPDARAVTWDILRGGYGPDVAFIDRALTLVFARCAVDPTRVGIEGFSDGASYALTLGLDNGDLFAAVLAFSPGFLAPHRPIGRPRVFVSHGRQDPVLPIQACSRRIVPLLQRAGYPVRYREFDGGHTVPADVLEEALRWFLDDSDMSSARFTRSTG